MSVLFRSTLCMMLQLMQQLEMALIVGRLVIYHIPIFHNENNISLDVDLLRPIYGL